MYILNRRWLSATMLMLLIMAGAYALYAVRSIPRGGSPTGYALGIVGTLLILVLMALPIRKRQYQKSAGRLEAWMRTHVCLGILAGAVVGMHAGFNVMGTVSIGLTVLFILTLLSGVIGTYLYETLPRVIARMENDAVQQDALLARIHEVREALDTLVADKAEPLREAVMLRVAGQSPPVSLAPHHLAGWAMQYFRARGWRHQADRLLASDRNVLDAANTLIDHHTRLGRQLFYQRMLRQWLWMHVPLSVAMCTLLLVHIVSELYY